MRPLERSTYPEVNRWDAHTWAVVSALILLGITTIIYTGIMLGSMIAAHAECANVENGKVLRSNTTPWSYCHVYRKN